MVIADVVVIHSANQIFVKIITEDGLVGYGEGSGFLPRAVAGMVEELRPYLLGQDARRIQQLWQEVFRRPFVRGGPVTGSAVAAIDMALWDIKGRSLGAPVFELLGGQARDKVRIYAHATGNTVTEIATRAKQVADSGATVVRFRGFHDTDAIGLHDHARAVRQQVEYTEAIRDAVGPDVDLILECHGRYDPEFAVKLAKQVEQFNLLFMEDPIRHENPEGFRQLRAQTSIPLATGERAHNRWDLRELIVNRLVDYVRPDICWAGGITEMMKIAAFAEVYYISVVPHNVQGPLGAAASLHASLAIPNLLVMEAAKYGAGAPDVEGIGPWPTLQDGYALPPTGAGLGVTIDESVLPPPADPGQTIPSLHALDGSVRDW